LRSLLYVPGHTEKMIRKGIASAADGLILNLEDGIDPARKAEARAVTARLLAEDPFGDKTLMVRINAFSTGFGFADILELMRGPLPAILLPKADAAEDVGFADRLLAQLESYYGKPVGMTKLYCLIESAAGVLAAADIAQVGRRVSGLVFGSGDYARDTGCILSDGEMELLFARSQLIAAARAAGIAAIDAPYFKVNGDESALRAGAERTRALGFDGKSLIHPAHIATVNEVFSPSEAEIERARRVVEAMVEARRQGQAAVLLDGELIEPLHLSTAEKTLAAAARLSRPQPVGPNG
jgi:citrate lyase beta subunit